MQLRRVTGLVIIGVGCCGVLEYSQVTFDTCSYPPILLCYIFNTCARGWLQSSDHIVSKCTTPAVSMAESNLDARGVMFEVLWLSGQSSRHRVGRTVVVFWGVSRYVVQDARGYRNLRGKLPEEVHVEQVF